MIQCIFDLICSVFFIFIGRRIHSHMMLWCYTLFCCCPCFVLQLCHFDYCSDTLSLYSLKAIDNHSKADLTGQSRYRARALQDFFIYSYYYYDNIRPTSHVLMRISNTMYTHCNFCILYVLYLWLLNNLCTAIKISRYNPFCPNVDVFIWVTDNIISETKIIFIFMYILTSLRDLESSDICRFT